MPLSWNEIKSRAVSFAAEWRDTVREEADAKPFLIAFLNIFGISQRRVATFEHRVKKANKASGYIDLLWPGTLLVEMKSRGEDLDKAYKQATDYCHGLKEYELPKLILVSDFQRFHIYREDGLQVRFELHQLIDNLTIFEDLAGYQKRTYYEEDPVNIQAAELMGRLHDQLKEVGYPHEALEVYLVRLLFILFADDTTVFQKGIFLDYLEQRTAEDGSDLAMHLAQLFEVLDTPEGKRMKTLDEQLNIFPYVNGRLFAQRLPMAAFSSAMRKTLMECCRLDWGKISPAIFGSLFQSVMDSTARRNLGAHYTSEKNIMKVIKPLFLDELWEEFHAAGENHNKLKDIHRRISSLRFLDPACGCGNFLIIAYRELRLLELAIVEKLLKGQLVTGINQYFLVSLNQFYGIELGEFPSQIAQVAMWLIDHQMNMIVSDRFGEYIPLIPLQKSATIVNTNALEVNWSELSPEYPFSFIMGNPPFIGSKMMTESQRREIGRLFGEQRGTGVLDYVCGWYKLGALYSQQHGTDIGFVSTNSVTQGEQVGTLWKHLMTSHVVQINFAHQTFAWSNEAKGNAGVYCVIIGYGIRARAAKLLYTYESVKGAYTEHRVPNINAYLTTGKNIFISNRKKPLCHVPEITKGNQPTDGGHLLLDQDEYSKLVKEHPVIIPYIKKLIGAQEFIQGIPRYCLWLSGVDPKTLKSFDFLKDRLEGVRKMREVSTDPNTRKLASTPYVFRETRVFERYIVIPSVSSERRSYIPIGFLRSDTIPTNLVLVVPDASLYIFGVLTSQMHMAWVRFTCGRIKSDFRYSKDIVYNNFPWPIFPTDKQKAAVEAAVQQVLDARLLFPDASLADLYDPNTMPPALVKAHQQLDKAVDLCYRPQPFASEAKRIEFLFELYDQYTGGMFIPEKKTKHARNKEAASSI